MTSLPRGPSGITSTSGAAKGSGNRSTTPYGVGPGKRPVRSPNRAPGASTARPSRRRGPPVLADTTREKKINGIKRHILVDTIGLVLVVVVHAANLQDRDGAKLVCAAAMRKGPWPRMERVWADGGYAGKLIAWVGSLCRWILEIVKRNDDVKGFKLLPRRWVVERTFSWLSNYRRLSKHYEYWDETGEAMIHLAMIHLMLRRFAKKRPLVSLA
jgi:transposase